jgi:citrate synthase
MTILSEFDPELEYTQANTAKYTEVTQDGGCMSGYEADVLARRSSHRPIAWLEVWLKISRNLESHSYRHHHRHPLLLL